MRVRRLHEARSVGDAGWFQPALDRIAAVSQDPEPVVRDFFDLENPLFVARAPGRLDVMGGIADYSGATVLQLPLDRSTVAIVQRQRAPRCDVATRRSEGWDTFAIGLEPVLAGTLASAESLAAWFRARPRDHWAAYVVGVVQHCVQRVEHWVSAALPGVRVLIESTVPEGKGVSSSAALEVAVMTATACAYGVAMAPEEIAIASQWVENHVVGAPCGIMDQMTSACGWLDRLLQLRCQPGTIEGYLDIPHAFRFFGIDSGVRHAVTGADYGTVRTAAFMGYRIIADLAGLPVVTEDGRVRVDDPAWNGYLANIPRTEFADRFEPQLPATMAGDEFLARYGGITDTVTRVVPDRRYPVRVATAHPVYEQERVVRFGERLSALGSDAQAPSEMGSLMAASHRSYSACGLGSDGTDRLVALIEQAGVARGCFGAKITGGGSGGTVAILASADAGPAIAEIARAYGAETGRPAEMFEASGPGAGETGVLILER